MIAQNANSREFVHGGLHRQVSRLAYDLPPASHNSNPHPRRALDCVAVLRPDAGSLLCQVLSIARSRCRQSLSPFDSTLSYGSPLAVYRNDGFPSLEYRHRAQEERSQGSGPRAERGPRAARSTSLAAAAWIQGDSRDPVFAQHPDHSSAIGNHEVAVLT